MLYDLPKSGSIQIFERNYMHPLVANEVLQATQSGLIDREERWRPKMWL